MSGSKDGRHVPPGGVALAARGRAGVIERSAFAICPRPRAMHGFPAPALLLAREQGVARRSRTSGECW